jgi:hypothetical protein
MSERNYIYHPTVDGGVVDTTYWKDTTCNNWIFSAGASDKFKILLGSGPNSYATVVPTQDSAGSNHNYIACPYGQSFHWRTDVYKNNSRTYQIKRIYYSPSWTYLGTLSTDISQSASWQTNIYANDNPGGSFAYHDYYWVMVYFYAQNGGAGTDTTYHFSNVKMSLGAFSGTYYDGASSGWYWSGSAYGSWSGAYTAAVSPVASTGAFTLSGTGNKPIVAVSPVASTGAVALSGTAGIGAYKNLPTGYSSSKLSAAGTGVDYRTRFKNKILNPQFANNISDAWEADSDAIVVDRDGEPPVNLPTGISGSARISRSTQLLTDKDIGYFYALTVPRQGATNLLNNAGFERGVDNNWSVTGFSQINHVKNPRMNDSLGDGIADSWTIDAPIDGTLITYTDESTDQRFEQVIQYIPGSGYSGEELSFTSDQTATGSFSSGDSCGFGFELSGTSSYGIVTAKAMAYDSSGNYLSDISLNTVADGTTESIFGGTYNYIGVCPASTSKVAVSIVCSSFTDADMIDLSLSHVIVYNSPNTVDYFDGNSPGCSWSGTEDSSTSLSGPSLYDTSNFNSSLYPSGYGHALRIIKEKASGTSSIESTIIPINTGERYVATVYAYVPYLSSGSGIDINLVTSYDGVIVDAVSHKKSITATNSAFVEYTTAIAPDTTENEVTLKISSKTSTDVIEAYILGVQLETIDDENFSRRHFDIEENTMYVFATYMYAPRITQSSYLKLCMTFYENNDALTEISTLESNEFRLGENYFEFVQFQFVSPADARYVDIFFEIGGDESSTIWVTGAIVDDTLEILNYFDGSFEGVMWEGSPHNSESRKLTPLSLEPHENIVLTVDTPVTVIEGEEIYQEMSYPKDGLLLDLIADRAFGGTTIANNTDPIDTWKDISPYSSYGTLSGFGYTTSSGWSGGNIDSNPYCLAADGTNDYVDFGNLSQLAIQDKSRSIAMWVNITSRPVSGIDYIVSKKTAAATGQGWYVGVNSSGNIVFSVANDITSTKFRTITGATPLTNGTWYHIVVTYDERTSDMTLYVNNAKDTSATLTGAVGRWDSDTTKTLRLFAGDTPTETQFTNAKIASLQIYSIPYEDPITLERYNRILSTTEIADSYHSPPVSVAGASAIVLNTSSSPWKYNITTEGLLAWLQADAATAAESIPTNAAGVTTWYDISGYGNNGTLTTFSFTPSSGWTGTGVSGDEYRLSFDHGSDYVLLPDLSAAEDRTFTYECWVRTTYTTNNCILSEGNTADTDSSSRIATNSSGYIQFLIYNNAGNSSYVSSTGAFNDGLLHHVVATCTATQMKLYIDGSSVGTPTAPPAAPITIDKCVLGALISGASLGSYFGGSLPCVRIYNRALSQDEVTKNFAAGPRSQRYAITIEAVIGSFQPNAKYHLSISGYNKGYPLGTNITRDSIVNTIVSASAITYIAGSVQVACDIDAVSDPEIVKVGSTFVRQSGDFVATAVVKKATQSIGCVITASTTLRGTLKKQDTYRSSGYKMIVPTGRVK